MEIRDLNSGVSSFFYQIQLNNAHSMHVTARAKALNPTYLEKACWSLVLILIKWCAPPQDARKGRPYYGRTWEHLNSERAKPAFLMFESRD